MGWPKPNKRRGVSPRRVDDQRLLHAVIDTLPMLLR